MNNTELTPNLNDDAPDSGTLPPDWTPDAALDIDAALAAVSSLSDVAAEREADEQRRADAKRSAAPTYTPTLKLPPVGRLKRGQPGSVLFALGLIGFGSWLTLTTTAGTPPPYLLTITALGGGVALILILQAFLSGGWQRGAVFLGLFTFAVGGVIALGLPDDGIDLTRAYPLLLIALGVVAGIAGMIGRLRLPRILLPAALCVLAGGLALLINADLLPLGDLAPLAVYAPIPLVVLIFLWLLPLVARRR